MDRSTRSCGDLDGGLAAEAVVQRLHSSFLRLDLGRVFQRVRRSPLVLKHVTPRFPSQTCIATNTANTPLLYVSDSLMPRYVIIALIDTDVPRYCSGRYH